MRQPFAFIISLSLSAALCAPLSAQAPAPAISFDKTHHDFGSLEEGQKASHRFRATNTGTAPLTIGKVVPSCGCTYTVLGKTVLMPGEHTFIEVFFDASGMGGSIHKSLEVNSDDPANPKTVLTFEAGVLREVVPSVNALHFDGVKPGGSVTSTVRLESGTGLPVRVLSAKCPGSTFIKATAREEGNDAQLDVTFDAALAPKGRQRGSELLSVRTSSKGQSTVELFVYWELESAILATPPKISFRGGMGQGQSAKLHLQSRDGKRFRVLGAKTTSKFIGVGGVGAPPAAVQTLTVTLSPKVDVPGLVEKLTLNLDHPEQTGMEVDITAVLQ